MNAPTLLEDRLRHGLHAAAGALPAAPLSPPSSLTPPVPGGAGPSSPRLGRAGRPGGGGAPRRWVPLAAAVAVVRPDGEGGRGVSDVRVASPGQGAEAPGEVRVTNGRVPGRAVVAIPDGGTSEVRTYAPDGTATGTVDLAPLETVQAASSDLEGGWVACGYVPNPDPPPEGEGGVITQAPLSLQAPDGGATASPGRVEQFTWFPAGRAPVVLEAGPLCIADAVQVVDSPEGPTLVYPHMSMTEFGNPALRALVLATGEDSEIPLPSRPAALGDVRWAASTGRVAVTEYGALKLFDMASGESLPVAAIEVPRASDISLAPDATSLAVLVPSPGSSDPGGPVDAVVYDLATGAERFRETFPISVEGAQLSYDGTTLAVGSYYHTSGDTVTVIDLASGARHTIEGHGLVL
jgi:hypothetical protein